mmetsp:Transcript_6957/g.7778  ORF Transcript_6957/g.7778 Transcript_6957/m.7778 type:complete len:171 (-) Transcript_6957:64-576(-)
MLGTNEVKRIRQCIKSSKRDTKGPMCVVENESISSPRRAIESKKKIIKLMGLYSNSRSMKVNEHISPKRNTQVNFNIGLKTGLQNHNRKMINYSTIDQKNCRRGLKKQRLIQGTKSPSFTNEFHDFTRPTSSKCSGIHTRTKKVNDLLNLVSEQEMCAIRNQILTKYQRD